MPQLGRILIYPIKSLDPLELQSVRILNSGAIEHDRQFEIIDAAGKVLNGKRTPLVHRIRATFDDQVETVTLRFDGDEARFNFDRELESIETWLSNVFDQPVRLLENRTAGFPDDTESPGPTVISTATLETITTWFPGLTTAECRLRFRTNLEIADVEPFWEDRLYGRAGSAVEFRIGAVTLAGTNPCQRCVVPTRDSQTGEIWPRFTPQFNEQRAATLPAWAESSRFNHFYRLAVNTHLASRGGVIRVGDVIEVSG